MTGKGAGSRPIPSFLATRNEWRPRPQLPLWPRRRAEGCHFQEPLASQCPEPESGVLALCVPGELCHGSLCWEDRGSGRLKVRWPVVRGLAGCMPGAGSPQPPQPPNPVPSAPPVIGHSGSCRLPRRLDAPPGRGSCRLGPAAVGGSIKVPVALATLASGHFGEPGPGRRQMEGEEAALSLAGVCPRNPVPLCPNAMRGEAGVPLAQC